MFSDPVFRMRQGPGSFIAYNGLELSYHRSPRSTRCKYMQGLSHSHEHQRERNSFHKSPRRLLLPCLQKVPHKPSLPSSQTSEDNLRYLGKAVDLVVYWPPSQHKDTRSPTLSHEPTSLLLEASYTISRSLP